MNKSRKDILQHLENVGYKQSDMERIAAYLIGAGIKTFDDFITIKVGNRTFKDFYKWCTHEEVKDVNIITMFVRLF